MGFVFVNMRVSKGFVHVQFNLQTVKTRMIDCAPFGPRPDQFLSAALNNTNLKCKPPQKKVLGEWTFDFSEELSSANWNKILPVIIANLHRLQDSGCIRYAEWTPPIK